MGLPETAFTLSAAPPRLSPSIFVSMAPVKWYCHVKMQLFTVILLCIAHWHSLAPQAWETPSVKLVIKYSFFSKWAHNRAQALAQMWAVAQQLYHPVVAATVCSRSYPCQIRLHFTLVSPAVSWTVQCLPVSTDMERAAKGNTSGFSSLNLWIIFEKDTHLIHDWCFV